MITDNFGITSNGNLIIPRGKLGLSPIELDLQEIIKAERKVPEMARSTPITLPDLITTFNVAIIVLAKAISIVELERRDAKRELEFAESIFTLDYAEEVLSQKGIKSSVDARKAAANVSPMVIGPQQTYDILTTASEYLQNLRSGLEMAYHGAKKICDVYVRTPDQHVYAGERHE